MDRPVQPLANMAVAGLSFIGGCYTWTESTYLSLDADGPAHVGEAVARTS